MRKIIRGIVNGGSKFLKELNLENCKIIKVYTILNEKEMLVNGNDLENENLKHWYTVFLEDKIHDWDISNGIFYFYGHSSEKGEVIDLLIEYQ